VQAGCFPQLYAALGPNPPDYVITVRRVVLSRQPTRTGSGASMRSGEMPVIAGLPIGEFQVGEVRGSLRDTAALEGSRRHAQSKANRRNAAGGQRRTGKTPDADGNVKALLNHIDQFFEAHVDRRVRLSRRVIDNRRKKMQDARGGQRRDPKHTPRVYVHRAGTALNPVPLPRTGRVQASGGERHELRRL
jgi:hypothetical protein